MRPPLEYIPPFLREVRLFVEFIHSPFATLRASVQNKPLNDRQI
jgi:hypothetical protein